VAAGSRTETSQRNGNSSHESRVENGVFFFGPGGFARGGPKFYYPAINQMNMQSCANPCLMPLASASAPTLMEGADGLGPLERLLAGEEEGRRRSTSLEMGKTRLAAVSPAEVRPRPHQRWA
jgi:hypothetical protein